jgi:hypothetical protein
MRNGHGLRHSAAASACTADGGGDSAGALRRFAASANGAPDAVQGVHVGVGIDEQSNDSEIAVNRRPVQRSPAIAVHGGAGVRGVGPIGVPRYPAGTRTQTSTLAPRVDYVLVLEPLTIESTPRGLAVLAISLPARASSKRAKLQKVAETAIAGEGGGEKAGDSARRQESVQVTEREVVTGTEVRLHATSQSRDWCLTQGWIRHRKAGSDVRRRHQGSAD